MADKTPPNPPHRSRFLKSPYFLVGTAALLLIAGAVTVYQWFPPASPARATMLLETFKLLVQALLMGVVAALAIKHWEAARAASTDRSKFLDAFRQDVTQAYAGAKKVRRLLKARTHRGSTPTIDFTAYELNMLSLNDQQLAIETFVRELDARSRDFGSVHPRIKHNLRSMEKYLRALVNEYQDTYPPGATTSTTLPLQDLPKLREFTGSDHERFDACFSHPFGDTLLALRGEDPRPDDPEDSPSERAHA